MIILKKQPLPKSLDNYIATFRRLSGNPKSIVDSTFNINDWVDNPITPTTNATEYSPVNELGFNVTINEIVYSKFAITAAGYLILLDPNIIDSTSSFFNQVIDVESDEVEEESVVIYSNAYILKRFKSNAILIAPWMGNNNSLGRNVKSLVNTKYSSVINSTLEQKIVEGKDKRNWPFNYIDSGTRWKRSYDHKRGKCIIARWTVSQENYGQKFKFEASIFENGEIEFKYWPIGDSLYVASNSPKVPFLNTVGVFWQGIDIGENKFRDFSIFFDYERNREKNQYGGTSLSDYTETPKYSQSAKRFGTQVSEYNWPKNGAIINFLPPKSLLKMLPRKSITSIDSNSHNTPVAGTFDDRKTFIYNTENSIEIDMPSTLGGRLHANSSDTDDLKTQQVLVSYSGIKMRNKQRKDSIESAMKINKSFSKTSNVASFDESNQHINISKSFYTSGSSAAQFGDGFSEPLTSKKQLKMSLQIQTPIKMPVSESCFYYYDAGLKTWIMPFADSQRSIENVNIDSAANDTIYNGELNIEHYNRIVENAIGFDAVGRKIVSGNIAVPSDFDYAQSSYAIGALLNSDDMYRTIANFDYFNQYSNDPGIRKQVINSALSHKYENSITDNQNFLPSKPQQLDLNIDYPFLIEKIVVELPISASNEWFKDMTTCNKAHVADGSIANKVGYAAGPIDFGGPALTFAVHCQKSQGEKSHLDLIASGTITHHLDDTASIVFKQDPGTNYYVARNAGFKSFSSPTTVISGTWNGSFYEFDGKVKLELDASVSSGVTIVRNSIPSDASGNTKAIQLFTSKKLSVLGESGYGYGDGMTSEYDQPWQARRNLAVYLQQVSPLCRGTSEFNISGNSILGNGFLNFKVSETVDNPLYVADTFAEFPADIQTGVTSTTVLTNGKLEILAMYSQHKSSPSPYLINPGEKLSISISKTRPVINKMFNVGTGDFGELYGNFILTGSHDSVYLNTGSIDITVYGSYVREGKSYNK